MNSRASNKDRIAIIGRLPPPFGGVTVHLLRFLDCLKSAEIPFVFCDLGGKEIPERYVVPFLKNSSFFWRLLTLPCRAVHLHTSKIFFILIILLLMCFRPRLQVILTLHNQSPLIVYRRSSRFGRWVFRLIIHRTDYLIVSNDSLADWAVQGLSFIPNHVCVAPAFLPPSPDELTFNDFPGDVETFFSSHSPVLGSQGFFGNFLNGKHVYQFEQIGELLERIREQFPNAGCFTAISGCYDEQHREAIFELRREHGLEKDWLFLENKSTVVPLYSRCDLFLRPTLTDGDSVSVRECILLGIPVVASNAVSRPKGVNVYDVNIPSQFWEESLRLLREERDKKMSEDMAVLMRLDAEKHAEAILDIYREILAGGRGRNQFGI